MTMVHNSCQHRTMDAPRPSQRRRRRREEPRPRSEASRVTYAELALHPPQKAVEESFAPILHDACFYENGHPATVTVVPPQGQDPSLVPTLTLWRAENPTVGYARLPDKRSIQLHHHEPGWGHVWFGIECPCIGDNLFQAPPADEADYVAVKQISKAALARYRQTNGAEERGGEEDPYKEMARLQELGDDQHVLACRDALETDDHLFLVTRRGTGTLKDLIPWLRSERLPMERVRSIIGQVLDILDYLAEHGISHRDFSPDNLLFLEGDKLVAFDLALSLRIPTVHGQRTLLLPQGNFGTHAYMAPEVFLNRVYDGVGADLWSASVTIYNLLTNQILYELPHPVDICFRYFIFAQALWQPSLNERAVEVLREIFAPGTPPHRHQASLLSQAQAHLDLDDDAKALLESLLAINPHHRRTLAATMDSDFLNPG